MDCRINQTPYSFNAEMLDTQTMKEITKMAKEKNLLPKLQVSLHNISRRRRNTLLGIDVCYTDKFPTVVFSRYEKKWDPVFKEELDEYVLKKQTDYISSKANEDPISFALKRLIKLGNNNASNNMFDEVVIARDTSRKKSCLF